MPDLLIEIGCEELPAAACREAERAAAASSLPRRSPRPAWRRARSTHPRRPAAAGRDRARRARRARGRAPRAARPARRRAGAGPGRVRPQARAGGADELEERDGFVWAVSEGQADAGGRAGRAASPRGIVGRAPVREDDALAGRPLLAAGALAGGEARRRAGGGRAVRGCLRASESRGHRFLGGEVRIGSAATYLEDLRGVHVVADAGERRELIREGLDAAGEWIDPMGKLDEVVVPGRVAGGARGPVRRALPAAARLRVPVTAMQSHQRYFPVVREGAARRPLRASWPTAPQSPRSWSPATRRCWSGGWRTPSSPTSKDLDRGIEAMLAELGRVSFLEGAGSLADKPERVRELAAQLCDRVEAEPGVRPAVARAAELCKADLVSSLVSEFSDLQGYAGSRVRARRRASRTRSARRSRSTTCRSRPAARCRPTEGGALLAVADKVDTIAVRVRARRAADRQPRPVRPAPRRGRRGRDHARARLRAGPARADGPSRCRRWSRRAAS